MVPDLVVPFVRTGTVPTPTPTYQTPGSAGLDLYAAIEAPITLAPLERARVSTGIAIELPDRFEAQVRPRSGLALRTGVTVLNSPGTIDSDFRGTLEVLLINLGSEPATIQPLDRVAQLVVAPVAKAELVAVTSLGETERGDGGYGSTDRARGLDSIRAPSGNS